MSAFVVEDKTINRAVSFIAFDREGQWIRSEIETHLGIDLVTDIGRETLGKLMFSLNCDAVNQRYGDNEAQEFRPLDYKFRMEVHTSRIHAFKALQCWSYQCCEGDIEDSELYKVMERVKGCMAEMIVTRLDAYEKANWG